MDAQAAAELDRLVPPAELIMDGAGSREEFAASGVHFMHKILIPRCGLTPESAVLDMGFGNGRHARRLTQQLSAGGRYVGFDIVKASVDWCREAYAPYPNFRFEFAELYSSWYAPHAVTRAEDYAFPCDATAFDIAFGTSLFTHLQPPAAANYLRQAARALKPTGRLYLSAYLMRDGAAQRVEIQGRRFNRASDAHHILDPDAPERGIAYDELALRALIAAAGLVVAEIDFGVWANPIDHLGGFQDGILAVKPA